MNVNEISLNECKSINSEVIGYLEYVASLMVKHHATYLCFDEAPKSQISIQDLMRCAKIIDTLIDMMVASEDGDSLSLR